MFNKYIFSFEKQRLEYEKMDNNENLWKFVLEDFTMKDYLYFRYYLERLSEIDSSNPDVMNEAVYARPILYIKEIWRNNEQIEDWNEHILPDKIKLVNMLPSEVVVDTRVKTPDLQVAPGTSLSNFISANFDFEKMFKEILDTTISCPHCEQKYTNVFKFDDFFMF